MSRALRRHRRKTKIAQRIQRLRAHWGRSWADDSQWVTESGRLDKLAVSTRYTKHKDWRDMRRGVLREDELEGFGAVLGKRNRVLRSPQFPAAERRGGWPGTVLAAGSMPDEDRIPKVWQIRGGRHYIRVGAKIVCVTDSFDEALNVMYGVRRRKRVR
jgi:hypothetical protein